MDPSLQSWYPDPDNLLSSLCEICGNSVELCGGHGRLTAPRRAPTFTADMFYSHPDWPQEDDLALPDANHSDLQYLTQENEHMLNCSAEIIEADTVQAHVQDTYLPGDYIARRHQLKEHRFPCPYEKCDKVFRRKVELNRHSKTHLTNLRHPYKCPECDQGFFYPKDLWRHERVHIVDPPATCYCHVVGCANLTGFRRRDNLLRHYRKVHPGVPLPNPANFQSQKLSSPTKEVQEEEEIDSSKKPESLLIVSRRLPSNRWTSDLKIDAEALECMEDGDGQPSRFNGSLESTPEGMNPIFHSSLPEPPSLKLPESLFPLSSSNLPKPLLPPQTSSPSSSPSVMVEAPSKGPGERYLATTKDTPSKGAPSDSGYHSGLGHNTDSVCSIDSFASSLGLPRDFLQEFVVHIGGRLVQSTEAKNSIYDLPTRAHAERKLEELLKEYSLRLTTQKSIKPEPDQHQRHLWTQAAKIVRVHRPKITRYFLDHCLSGAPLPDQTLGTRLRDLGEQLSVREKMELAARLNPRSDIPEEDVEMLDDGFEDVLLNLEPISDFLVGGEAFKELAIAVRQTLCSGGDIMEQIRATILKGLSSSQSAGSRQKTEYSAKLIVDWNIPNVIAARLGLESPDVMHHFKDVVTLIGSISNAQATTCAEYLNNVWPDSGAFFLAHVHELLSNENRTESLHSLQVSIGGLRLHSTVRNRTGNGVPTLEIGLVGSLDEVVEFSQQLAWFKAAFSSSPFREGLAYAKAFVQCQPKRTPEFRIIVEHEPLAPGETSCWLPLFYGASIAYGFPVPKRQDEMGLELSTQLMAALTGARHAVDFEGGIVMKGFSTMFVPIKKQQDRIQWHLVTNDNLRTRLTYKDGISRCSNRAKLDQVSLEDLQTCRAIVGWCTKVTSILGAPTADYENLDYSGAEDATSNLACSGGALGVQYFGVGQLNLGLVAGNSPFVFKRGQQPFEWVINEAEQERILLYDTATKNAWLVPAIDVVLHIAQQRHHLKPFKVDQQPVELPWRDSSVLSRDLILDNASMNLSSFGKYTFMELVQDIWSDLEYLLDLKVNQENSVDGKILRDPFREQLQGFEFRAVAERRLSSQRRQSEISKSCGGWPALIRDINALVLFANGFGQVLRPIDDGGAHLCHRWRSVPDGHDYLATTVDLLKDLYNVAGCRTDRTYLTNTRLRWHTGGSITFDSCNAPNLSRCKCNRLQEIVPKAAIGEVLPPAVLADNGAVIFGHSGTMFTGLHFQGIQDKKQKGLYAQDNSALPMNVQDDVTSDDQSSVASDDDGDDDGTRLTSIPSAASSNTSYTSNAASIADLDRIETMAIQSLLSPPNTFYRKRRRACDNPSMQNVVETPNGSDVLVHCKQKQAKRRNCDDLSDVGLVKCLDTADDFRIKTSNHEGSLARYSRRDFKAQGRSARINQPMDES